MSDVVESVINFGTTLPTLRRIYLKNRKVSHRAERWAESSVWQFKQESEPGTALPGTFPFLTQLTTAGYTTVDDLNGADVAELVDWACISSSAARAVLAAAAAL